MRYADRYDSTMKEWGRILAKAEEKLNRSKKCYELFGDDDSKQWIEEDRAEVNRIKANIEIVKARFEAC